MNGAEYIEVVNENIVSASDDDLDGDDDDDDDEDSDEYFSADENE